MEKEKQAYEEEDINIDNHADTPIRYVSLDRVYSAASLCVSASGSSNVIMSKKVKARKLLVHDDPCVTRPPLLHVYSRRHKRPRHSPQTSSFYESLVARAGESVPRVAVKSEICELEDAIKDDSTKKKKRKMRIGSSELVKLGVDSSVLRGVDGPRLRDCRNHNVNNNSNNNMGSSNGDSNNKNLRRKKLDSTQNCDKVLAGPSSKKKWVRYCLNGYFCLLGLCILNF